tara:strand:+ start:1862 stop:2536 length:675 start_codon:yes stop_codon:yes gene_type:complete
MDWITESARKAKKLRNHYKLHDIDIFIKDPMPDDIDVDYVLAYISKRLPRHLLRNVDIIYIGQFKDLVDREINAMYENGAIFVTNDQIDDGAFIDDLVHEVAHSNESSFKDIIYGDNMLNREFKAKRNSLYRILKDQMGIVPPKALLYDVTFNQEIDDFLYKEIGYTNLNSYSVGLFTTPYACTSLREYFARGFEQYYLGERKILNDLCPVLYSKIYTIDTLED